MDAPNPEVRIRLGLAIAVAVSFGIILVFLLRLVIRSQRKPVTTGSEALAGMMGKARTAVDEQGGKVFVNGEWWEAVSTVPIAAGSRVRIIEAKDLVLTVETDLPPAPQE